MDTQRVLVTSMDVDISQESTVVNRAQCGGWTMFGRDVLEHVGRVPMKMRLFACAKMGTDRIPGMEFRVGFVVHDDIELGAIETREVRGQEVAYQEPRSVQWLRTVRSWKRIGWQGTPQRTFGFMPLHDVGDWWLFWADIGTPLPQGLRFTRP